MAGLVQSAAVNWFGGGATVTINGVTAGNLLAIYVAWATGGSTLTGISGNSNTYTSIGSASGGAGGGRAHLYYVQAANSGNTTVTVTWSGDPGFGGIIVHEVHGVDGGLDGANWVINPQAVPGAGTDGVTSTALTPSVPNCYRFGGSFDVGGGATLGSGTNYTLAGSPTTWIRGERLTANSGIDTGTGSASVTFTTDQGFNNYYTAQVIFKPGGGTTTTLTPGAGSLALTGRNPSLKLAIPVAKATLALTGRTPSLKYTLPVPKAILSLTGFAPTVLNGVIVSPAKGTLALTGFAPALKLAIPVPKATLSLTGFAPSLVLAGQGVGPAGQWGVVRRNSLLAGVRSNTMSGVSRQNTFDTRREPTQ